MATDTRGSNSSGNKSGMTISRDNSGSAVSKADETIKNAANSVTGTETGSISGYGAGSGYTGRETAFTWSDGSTTYSNATDWRDAAKEGGKEGLNLVGAVSYASSATQKALSGTAGSAGSSNGFTDNIYSRDTETGKNYTNAVRYEQQVQDTYGGGQNGYSGYNAYSAGGLYGINNNPYEDMLRYIQQQYNSFEDEIIRLNRASIAQGTQNLENQKRAVNKNYEDNARQAYINYLQLQHALPEMLSAQGITGGATETANLSLQNAYQGSLTDINNALAQAIFDIDNSIVELERSGNIEMARQVLANSQAALTAYQNMMQNYINYSYQTYRDQVGDQRYSQEYLDNQNRYEYNLNREEYSRVLDLINRGFTVNNASEILGVDERELNSYISYLNQLRALEIEKNQASIAKTLSTIKTPSGGSSSAKSAPAQSTVSQPATGGTSSRNDARSGLSLNQARGFAPSYGANGVTIPGYGTMSLQAAVTLYNEGRGPIKAYVDPSDYKIYFTA